MTSRRQQPCRLELQPRHHVEVLPKEFHDLLGAGIRVFPRMGFEPEIKTARRASYGVRGAAVVREVEGGFWRFPVD